MEHGDDISELSFFADDLGEMCANVKPVKKRIPCKVPGCPKVFSHASSMYRHFSHVHVPVKKENGSESTTTQTAKSDLNSHETTITRSLDPGSFTTFLDQTNDYATQGHNGKSVQEEMQDLQQQMLTADQGALFVHFQTVLETVAHADPNTIAHLKSFHRVLYKALLSTPTTPVETITRSETAHPSKRSLPADPLLYLTNIFVPSADLSFHLNSLGPTQVEFSDEGETSPFKRAHCAEIDFSRSYSEDMASRCWIGEHNTVTPSEAAALPSQPYYVAMHGVHCVSTEEAAQVSRTGQAEDRFLW